MRPPGFAMYLLHFHRIRCRCSFRQNSGYNERRRRKVRCRQQRFQLLPSQSGWRLQLRFPCTTDRKSKGGFLCFFHFFLPAVWTGPGRPAFRFRQLQSSEEGAAFSEATGCRSHCTGRNSRLLPDPDPVQQRSSDNYLQSDCSADSFSLLPRPGCFFLLHKNGLCRHRRSGQQQRRTDRAISAQWLLCNHFSRNPHSYRYFLLYPPDSTRDWHRPHRR